MLRLRWIILCCFLMAKIAVAQENSLNYFLAAAENNNPDLLQNQNLVQVGELQTELIRAENDFQFSATSEVMLAPYFNSNGNFMEVTTTPSPNAYGYAEPVSNGALYSAQLNIAKNIFNRSQIQNLQFQNKISNRAIELSSEEIWHQLKKTGHRRLYTGLPAAAAERIAAGPHRRTKKTDWKWWNCW